MKNIWEQFMNMPILAHLASAVFVVCFLVFIVLRGMDEYTRHNEAVIVPDVKGLQMEEAAIFFKNNGLRYVIVESVYSKEVKPGAIVSVNPSFGEKVKEGRIIYVTINETGTEKATIPDVADLSFRQALMKLQTQGFTTIETKYIAGPFQDLAIAVECNGRELKPGESVPLTSRLILKVSDGKMGGDSDNSDAIQSDETGTVRPN
ncbi:MAG: PASTA domain-containing protein [Tannerella sp.]|nr:PASTA domain-containing protein [Tannerella sp.]